MPSPWQWDAVTYRYRNTATGRFMSAKQMLGLRDQFVDAQKAKTVDLAERLASGKMTVQQWTLESRQLIKTTFIDEYVLARGGRHAMTQADWGRVGAMCKNQYAFLQNFAAEIQAGKLTAGQVATRLGMYVEAGTQAYERGNTAARGMPTLPAYPGDGQTVCRSNCRCHWDIETTETGWDCTWTLGAAEHCAGCVENAGKWNPLEVAA